MLVLRGSVFQNGIKQLCIHVIILRSCGISTHHVQIVLERPSDNKACCGHSLLSSWCVDKHEK